MSKRRLGEDNRYAVDRLDGIVTGSMLTSINKSVVFGQVQNSGTYENVIGFFDYVADVYDVSITVLYFTKA